MEPEQARESAERDQLWASLRALRAEIARLAVGEFEASDERQRQIVVLLARIVLAEMDFRARDAALE